LKSQMPKHELVIVIHNLKGYDSKLVLEAAEKQFIDDIEVIATSSENFMSMTIKCQGQKLKFIGSYMFLNSSLQNLVNEMNKKTDFHVTRQAFKHLGSNIKYLSGKGLYPYSYVTLTYYHALGTWYILSIKDLGEYHDYYCTIVYLTRLFWPNLLETSRGNVLSVWT